METSESFQFSPCQAEPFGASLWTESQYPQDATKNSENLDCELDFLLQEHMIPKLLTLDQVPDHEFLQTAFPGPEFIAGSTDHRFHAPDFVQCPSGFSSFMDDPETLSDYLPPSLFYSTASSSDPEMSITQPSASQMDICDAEMLYAGNSSEGLLSSDGWFLKSDVSQDPGSAIYSTTIVHAPAFAEIKGTVSENPSELQESCTGLKTTKRKKPQRLPIEAVNVLQDWLICHHLDPYPTSEERSRLAASSGLRIDQVVNWFSNVRSRKMSRAKPRTSAEHHSCVSEISHDGFERENTSTDDGIHCPPRSQKEPVCELNSMPLSIDALSKSIPELGQTPMQRFLSTPPEEDPPSWGATKQGPELSLEPADSDASVQASNCLRLNSADQSMVPPVANHDSDGHPGRCCDNYSTAGVSSSSTNISRNSRASVASGASHASWAGRKGRRKHRHPVANRNSIQIQPRQKNFRAKSTSIYHCTWCPSSFYRAFEWQRHEETQHCPQREWICLFKRTSEDLGQFCEFCNRVEPTLDHYRLYHNASECLGKDSRQRAFARKDHLRQHIKQIHHFGLAPRNIDSWWRQIPNSVPEGGWLCGFCHARVETWNERMIHLKTHFECGLSIDHYSLAIDSQFPPRGTRTTLPRPFSFGCSECPRNFKSSADLKTHQSLPHLPRSTWTCSDLLTAILSIIPSSFNTLLASPHHDPENLAYNCGHCDTSVRFNRITAWRVAISRHLHQSHNIDHCIQVCENVEQFAAHLWSAHRLNLGRCFSVPSKEGVFELKTEIQGQRLSSLLVNSKTPTIPLHV